MLSNPGRISAKQSGGEPASDDPKDHLWKDALNQSGIAFAELTLGGKLIVANDPFCELLCRPLSDLLEKRLKDLFWSEEWRTQCDDGLPRLMAGKVSHLSIDVSVTGTNGQLVSVRMILSLTRGNTSDEPRSLISVATDITSLKRELQEALTARDELSRRMTNAQEADRTRIARELHDDIGQSLAVLKIQMLRAGQPVSGHVDRAHPSIRELVGKLDAIARKVSHLSHDLHSTELEFLGLAVAVKAQCREISSKLDLPIDCCCNQVQEKLDGMVALALLRVVQEALHNVLKHSRAKNIVVRLTGSGNSLTLEITDDGVGFDTESSRLAAGLGLISMRERMHLVHGEFELSSSPGHGTRIVARAPISLHA